MNTCQSPNINLKKIQVINVTQGAESWRGTTQFVMTLCEGLNTHGFHTEIWTPKYDRTEKTERNCIFSKKLVSDKVPIRRFKISMPRSLCRCKDICPALKSLTPRPALIHQHGLWLDPYRIAAKFARSNAIPLLISLHGMLEPWAMQRSRFKKKIAWSAFQGRDIRSARCLHVATRQEAENVRNMGIRNPVAIIPNGIRTQNQKPEQIKESETRNPKDFFTLYPNLVNKKLILSLGRIHPVKGLEFFGRIWSQIAGDFAGWHWVIAGPDEENYQSEFMNLFDKLGISGQTTFVGPVAGSEKLALFRSSEFLVLPSHMESFGMVVVEALWEGIPVMASTNCPWPELETYRCGWWLNLDTDTWKSSLRKAMSIDSQTLKASGTKGKNLVKEKYNEDQLVNSMSDVYRWILSGSERPSCLYSG